MNEPGTIPDWLNRAALFLPEETLNAIRAAHVLCVGLGGVGGIAAEMIARAGVSGMTIADGDCVEAGNINRQLPALHTTIGQLKTEVMRERLLSINPELKLTVISRYLEPQDMRELYENGKFTAVLDAIDSIAPKTELLSEAVRRNIPAVSSMGAGLRLNPALIQADDISKTSVCPLAKAVRKGLREQGIETGVTTVYSTEQPAKPGKDSAGRNLIGTISYMPAMFGVRCAAELIRILMQEFPQTKQPKE